MDESTGDLIRIFDASDAAVIPLVKSLLEGEQIDFMVRGEAVQDLIGWGRIGGANYAVGPVEFWVRPEDAERAAALLADLSVPGSDVDADGT